MNNNYTRDLTDYPSPAEVKVYIGQNWVDDIYRVDYTVSNPRTPLYDYTSTFFKDVVAGHSIVQGSIIINYRFPGYLRYAMQANKLIKDPRVIAELNEAALMFRSLAQGTSSEKVKNLLLYKKLGAMKHAKQVAGVLYSEKETVSVKQDYTVTQQEMPPFDVIIKYGGEEALSVKTIHECYLIGESQTISAASIAGGDMSSSGMPILEVYNFFGKRVSETITEKARKLQVN